MKRRKFNDPFPSLPPGVTPSDIPGNRPGVDFCQHCNAEYPDPDHGPGCPVIEDYCEVCNPPPDKYKPPKPVFCDTHDHDDLMAKEEALADRIQEPGPPMVPPAEEREDNDADG